MPCGCKKARDYLLLNIGSGIRPVKEAVNLDLPTDEATPHFRGKPIAPDIEGTIYDIPCADNTYDLVLMFHVLEHLRYPMKGMEEVVRVLKPKGRLLIEIPNLKAVPYERKEHLYSWSPHTIKNFLREAGFIILRRQTPLLDGLETVNIRNKRSGKYAPLEPVHKWNHRYLTRLE